MLDAFILRVLTDVSATNEMWWNEKNEVIALIAKYFKEFQKGSWGIFHA